VAGENLVSYFLELALFFSEIVQNGGIGALIFRRDGDFETSFEGRKGHDIRVSKS